MDHHLSNPLAAFLLIILQRSQVSCTRRWPFFRLLPGELIIRQAQGQARRSNVTEKFAKGGFYRLANSHQGLDGNDFFAALNFPNVFRIQVHNFRQVLLRQP